MNKDILQKLQNRAILADARDVLKYCPDKSVDLLFTDPPFSKDIKYDTYKDNIPKDEYWKMIEEVFEQVARVMKDDSSLYIKQSVDNIYPMMTILNRFSEYRNLIIWGVPSQAMPKDNYCSSFEIILFYTIGKPVFNEYCQRRVSIDKVPMDSSLRQKEYKGKMDSCWFDIPHLTGGCIKSAESILEEDSKAKVHPCQMAEGIVKRAILFSSNEGDLVLDPFGGIFTTAAVAKKLERNWISCDISEKYVEAGKKRLLEVEELMKQTDFLAECKPIEKPKVEQLTIPEGETSNEVDDETDSTENVEEQEEQQEENNETSESGVMDGEQGTLF